ncbi:trypsin-like serine protease [Streptomyces sp. NPDC048192]|uniref:trypsin-like serine protease n=1 Tax=Streptomyces sp. NPDC048192 TaxID=3365510 RepID=UPI00371DAE0D
MAWPPAGALKWLSGSPIRSAVYAPNAISAVPPRPQWQLLRAQPAPGATWNTCTGDSGGPVLATPSATTVTGIISRGPSCRVDDVRVYVSVAPLVPWSDHVANTPRE